MGEVLSLEAYRRARRASVASASAAGGDDAAVDRLERAILALELTMDEITGELEDPVVRQELLAVSAAVAVGRYALAAERTEGIIARLRHG
jgi:hypothetical protein